MLSGAPRGRPGSPTTPSIVGSAIDASVLARERRPWLPDDGGKVTSATEGSIAWFVWTFAAITDSRDAVVSTTSDSTVGERELVGVAAGASGPRRPRRRVRGIPRIEHVTRHERPRDADALVPRRQRHRPDRHPVLVDRRPTGACRPPPARAAPDRRPARRCTIPTAPSSPAYHCSVWPSSGPSGPSSTTSVHRSSGGEVPDAKLDLSVDLLERVGRHDQWERLLGALRHAAQLLHELRQRGLGRRDVRSQHMVEPVRTRLPWTSR